LYAVAKDKLVVVLGVLQTEEQTSVEISRIADPVGISNQRVEQGASLQQPVPVGTVAGQTGDLVAQYLAKFPGKR
jgi:hypothetical protein